AQAVGHPQGHPLRRVGRAQYSQQLRQSLPKALEAYAAAVAALRAAGEGLAEALELPRRGSFTSYGKLLSLARDMLFWLNVPPAWAQAPWDGAYAAGLRKLAERSLAARGLAERLRPRWRESFLELDAAGLLRRLNENDAKWALPKLLGANRIVKDLSRHSRAAVDRQALRQDLELLLRYREEKTAAGALMDSGGGDLGALYTGEGTDWQGIARLAEQARDNARRMDAEPEAAAARRRHGGDPALAEPMRRYIAAWNDMQGAKDGLYKLLDILPEDGAEDWAEREIALCRDVGANAEGLKEWTAWNGAAGEARRLGLDNAVEAYLAGMDHEDVLPAYYKALYRAAAEAAIDAREALNAFSGTMFEEKIARFRRLDGELTALTRQEIFCRLASRVPNFAREAAQSSELGILQRAIRSGGRGMSIRRLFELIPELLARLCPCMLMSPISAAQYLDPHRKPFDLVVFDEASQLPTCKAVGALARGENAVVVGDPNQMPPTSFFSTNTVDEDNLDVEDLESILDDCLALSMPQTHLLWHYRSRHESLIAFSNSQFYGNRLYTFPSANAREAKVKLVHVDGVFSRGKSRQNRAEAEAVVAELRRRCHDPALSECSVGVVTFNIMQQNLIEDLLMEACAGDGELERWAFEAPEPLFIKNLENVQGDERDVILFSIGYGPDESGRVSMNFGPLNREGGWRRLNVAVSRARREMAVFSTLTPEQIDLGKTAAQGVAALKAFLEYAGGKALPEDGAAARAGREDSGAIAEAIRALLAKNGYQADRDVGHSAYRVELGVVDPERPGRYLLGILLDGRNYAAAKSTRDREIAQAEVLKGLGWKLLRVWTLDWWDNSAKEGERILRAVREAEQGREAPAEHPAAGLSEEVPEDAEPLAEKARTAPPLPAPPSAAATPYAAAAPRCLSLGADAFAGGRYDSEIMAAVREILDCEAPICESLLMRRVAQSFGLTRAGSRIQEKMRRVFSDMALPRTGPRDAPVYWKEGQEPEAYALVRAGGEGEARRDAREVPPEEARAAVLRALDEQLSMSDDDLIREGARLLGYTRLGSSVAALLRSGIALAERSGRIGRNSGGKWGLL
ncbi:MAG: DUF3320 domain-containing protein, partial [Oscillospiraceae bacterium]|nr:DUF3320 domain-containing protein [Oscillospiraceae bacterium]